jgi:hypothetical protein
MGDAGGLVEEIKSSSQADLCGLLSWVRSNVALCSLEH